MTKAVPTLADIPPLLKAEILAEALPYIRQYHGKTIVITPDDPAAFVSAYESIRRK